MNPTLVSIHADLARRLRELRLLANAVRLREVSLAVTACEQSQIFVVHTLKLLAGRKRAADEPSAFKMPATPPYNPEWLGQKLNPEIIKSVVDAAETDVRRIEAAGKELWFERSTQIEHVFWQAYTRAVECHEQLTRFAALAPQAAPAAINGAHAGAVGSADSKPAFSPSTPPPAGESQHA